MPSVKKLVQESENSSKPQYIFWHMYGGVATITYSHNNYFAVPLKWISKTDFLILPHGINQGISRFALYIRKEEASLVTVGRRKFYIYRYEGRLNGMDNAVVLISYPENAFYNPKALLAFVCTDVSLTTEEILEAYVERWPIDLFFHQSKGKLALDKYQIRSSQGIHRYCLIMSFVHLLCCTKTGEFCSFEDGYARLQQEIKRERIMYIYQCGTKHLPLDDILDLVA